MLQIGTWNDRTSGLLAAKAIVPAPDQPLPRRHSDELASASPLAPLAVLDWQRPHRGIRGLRGLCESPDFGRPREARNEWRPPLSQSTRKSDLFGGYKETFKETFKEMPIPQANLVIVTSCISQNHFTFIFYTTYIRLYTVIQVSRRFYSVHVYTIQIYGRMESELNENIAFCAKQMLLFVLC